MSRSKRRARRICTMNETVNAIEYADVPEANISDFRNNNDVAFYVLAKET